MGLLPLLWIAALLVAIPWLLSRPRQVIAPRPAAAPASPVLASASQTAADDDPSDNIKLVIHLTAGHWIDTGVDMCGCAHIKVVASGAWQTPLGTVVNAQGALEAPSDSQAQVTHAVRLTSSAPYGALIGRVGHDPFALIGRSRQISGDQFSDSGTLKIGMNAGKAAASQEVSLPLTVYITGSGTMDHQPSLCQTPQSQA